MDDSARQSTIGILYPGEMGTALGKLLSHAGFRVVTTTEGRSARTQLLCRESGLTVLDSLGEVLEHAGIVVSLVSPAAALSVATDVAAHRQDQSGTLLYIDANSISPMAAGQICDLLGQVGVDFVDGSIFGLAFQLRKAGTLYLSGLRAKELSEKFGPFLCVRAIGDTPGQASALKMIVSSIPKGLSGLFVEVMLFARQMHLFDEAMEACDEIYPSIMEVMRRMLPTYPQHARRRCEELQAAEETMLMSGFKPRIVRAVREVTSDLAAVDWQDNRDPGQWTIAEIMREASEKGRLQSQPSRSIRVQDKDATVRC
jgi:3-hydroxyisobutyrate dehydrogenase-like beta-hydroxyacid dehydrogenase